MGLAAPPAGPVTGSSCDADRAAAVMAALASPWRIEIVGLLANGELDVTDIAERLGLSVANTSQHLPPPPTTSAGSAAPGW